MCVQFSRPVDYQPSRLLRSGKQLLLTVPRAKLAIGQRAFSYSSRVIWNAIPLTVRDAPSVSTFKRHLKSFYLTHSFPNLNIRHLATACASDSSYISLTMLRVINFRLYVCMYVCKLYNSWPNSECIFMHWQCIYNVRTSGCPSFVLIILDAQGSVTRLMWSCGFSGTRSLLN